MSLERTPFSYVGDLHASTDDITESMQKPEVLAKLSLAQLVAMHGALSVEINLRYAS
jgi:hypothetical protein